MEGPRAGIMSVENSVKPVESTNHVSKKKALAVNLSSERDRILEHGSRHLPIFLDNMNSFTKEVDTHGREFTFQHVVKRMPDGSVRLYWDKAAGQGSDGQESKTEPVLVEARSSYLIPALDETLPEWERRRNMKDYEAILSLERMLEIAQPGDTFIESAHAPFDQPDEALEGTFYGKFSFIRTHTFDVDDKGREVLRGQARRHYLDWQTQTELHAQLAGGIDVQPENLLGRVDKLQPAYGLEDIQDIDDIAAYIRGMDAASFVPHDAPSGPDEAAIDDYIKDTQVLPMSVFEKLSARFLSEKDKQEIKDLIKFWRKSVRDFCDGIDRRDEIKAMYKTAKKIISINSSRADIYVSQPIDELRAMYYGQDFREQDSSCGFGVGFNENSYRMPAGTVPSYVNFAYQYAINESKQATGPDERVVNCPGCKAEVKFSRAAVVKAQELNCGCGASVKGCDAEAVAHNSRPVKGISYENMDTPIAA